MNKPTRYPRIRSICYCFRGKCVVCGEGRADSVATIQVNWFRGDDDALYYHRACVPNERQETLLALYAEQQSRLTPAV